jgi:hypothetical protein
MFSFVVLTAWLLGASFLPATIYAAVVFAVCMILRFKRGAGGETK